MATTQIVGSDGSITMPSGTHDGVIRRWTASFPRTDSNVTAFSDTYEIHRLGLLNWTGTFSGGPKYDAAQHSPGVLDRVAGGSALTVLFVTGCSYAGTVAIPGIDLASDKMADATLDYSYTNASNTITETWDES